MIEIINFILENWVFILIYTIFLLSLFILFKIIFYSNKDVSVNEYKNEDENEGEDKDEVYFDTFSELREYMKNKAKIWEKWKNYESDDCIKVKWWYIIISSNWNWISSVFIKEEDF